MDRTGFNVYLSFRKYITRMLETQGEMVRFSSFLRLDNKKSDGVNDFVSIQKNKKKTLSSNTH